jgi:hypothetical protein
LVKPFHNRLNRYPGLFNTFLPLVIVGAVNVTGQRTEYSQGVATELDSSAVGNVVCPDGNGMGLQMKQGTSFGMT